MVETAPKPPITRWSFNALKTFERCPFQLYLKRVEQAPEPSIENDPNHPLTRGKRLHAEAEHFIKHKGVLAPELCKFSAQFHELSEKYQENNALAEERWGFDRDWDACQWEDPQCWLMAIADAVDYDAEFPRVIDFKTGKSYGNEVPHRQQLQLYAVAALMRHPDADVIRGELWYLDEGKVKARDYSRVELPELIVRWSTRAEHLTDAIAFPPKPNAGNCRFCPYSPNPDGNGRCPYGAEVEVKKVRR